MAISHASARRRLRGDLTILTLVGVLLLAALGTGGLALYREVYSPAAFVQRYLTLLADGRAADALRVPGVAVDRETLEATGITDVPSDALLRQAALGTLADVEVLSSETSDATTTVSVAYTAGGHAGRTTYVVEQDGWNGIVPRWRFAESPLAIVDVVVRGSDELTVNDFTFDRRQVAPEGALSDPLVPVPLLVFSPGLYAVSVQTPVSQSPGVRFLADSPMATTPLDVQTEPTEEFTRVVQERVEEFLSACATQRVLLPTGCPFGFEVAHRIDGEPEWSITQQPAVGIAPDGAHWMIPPTSAVAHIEVDVRSIFDGSIRHVSEDVAFEIDGTVTLQGDGTLSIRVGAPAG